MTALWSILPVHIAIQNDKLFTLDFICCPTLYIHTTFEKPHALIESTPARNEYNTGGSLNDFRRC